MSRSQSAAERLRDGGYVPPPKPRADSCAKCQWGLPVYEGEVKRISCTWHQARTAQSGWCPSFRREATGVAAMPRSCASGPNNGLHGGV